MAKAGLRKVTKTVRGKRGTVRRSYWVKSSNNSDKLRTSLKSGFQVGLASNLMGLHRTAGRPSGELVHYATQAGATGLAALRAHKARGGKPMGFGRALAHAASATAGLVGGRIAGIAAHEGARYALRRNSIFGNRR